MRVGEASTAHPKFLTGSEGREPARYLESCRAAFVREDPRAGFGVACAIVTRTGSSMSRRLRDAQRSLDVVQGRLVRTEQCYRALVECAPDAIIVQDFGSGTIVDANEAACVLFGYAREELLGMSPAALAAPETTDEVRVIVRQLRSAERVRRTDFVCAAKDGRRFRADLAADSYDVDGHKFTVTIIRDVTTRFEREAELSLSNAALRSAQDEIEATERGHRALLDATSDAILVADWETTKFVDANPAASDLLGYTVEEFRNMNGRALAFPEDGPLVDRVSEELKATGSARRVNFRLRRRDGSIAWFDFTTNRYTVGRRAFLVSVCRDVSERHQREGELFRSYQALRETQARLLQSAKLTALGELAGAMAHEMNGPMLGISTFGDLLLREIDPGASPPRETLQRWHDYADQIRKGVEACRELSWNLLSFARRPRFQLEPTELAGVVAGAVDLTRKRIEGQGSRLAVTLAPRLVVLGDASRLAQIVVNLLLNAAYSLGEGGTIDVEARGVGDHVEVSVRDDGPGVRREHLDRVFEPFFTTRPRGEGAGLGLTIAREIATDHHGRIDVESSPGRGATFTLVLPLLRAGS